MTKLTRTIGHQTYEVTHGNDNILHIPNGKSERISALRRFVMRECSKCWAYEDPRISTLKKEFLRELCDGLERYK